MSNNKEKNNLNVNNSSEQTALVHETDKMNLDQINEYFVRRSAVIREYVRKKRSEYQKEGIRRTSDIIPPICSDRATLHQNIDNVLACFSNTLAAALSSEAKYIQASQNFETLSSIVEREKHLIFDFLSKNGLAGKFNEFVKHGSGQPCTANNI